MFTAELRDRNNASIKLDVYDAGGDNGQARQLNVWIGEPGCTVILETGEEFDRLHVALDFDRARALRAALDAAFAAMEAVVRGRAVTDPND